jgi:RNA polymerase sigma factor (sigma-70 family)
METTNIIQSVTQEGLCIGDIQVLKSRTSELFEVMGMCEGNKEQEQICRNEIVELNIKLVPHVLKKYKPFGDDEFQMGCLGLIIATNTYDASRGVPFPNYACFCIERELHKAHRKNSNSFEYQMGGSLESLDSILAYQNGDEATKHDQISDTHSQEAFDQVLDDHHLTDLFAQVILPAINTISTKTKGQSTNVDFEEWRKLELRYILEMAEVNSQKARVTLSAIAKELGVSVQNIRMRHIRVIEAIKEQCLDMGIEV